MLETLCDVFLIIGLFFWWRMYQDMKKTNENIIGHIGSLNMRLKKQNEVIQAMQNELDTLKKVDSYKKYGGTADILMSVDYDFLKGEKVMYKVNGAK